MSWLPLRVSTSPISSRAPGRHAPRTRELGGRRPMKANFISLGAMCAALGVGLGAFGAHTLRSRLGPTELGLWETATRYLVIGALGTLLFGLFQQNSKRGPLPGWLLLVGSTLFAGSLYALALGGPRVL